ncbi:MAG: lamin tail domain-containing protein [Candidatus Marinimicrobia bacterium]|nr:lamin tail domain-containing protein [Candidatus Neomarinimicrobiota bacterium]
MRNRLFFILAVILILSFSYSQSIISYTSFEEPGLGGQYTDTGDAGTDHPLVNNTGEAIVNYDPGTTGSELGFSSYYTNTIGDVGLTDGDYIGVTDYQAAAGISYPDGDQGFQLSDCDGMVTVTLDTVDLSSASDPSVSCYYFIKEDGYEARDSVRIWVIADGTEIDLLNTTGSDIDDLGIEGSWNYLSQSLAGYSEAIFKFELQSNSANEQLFLDYIVFADGIVNVPPTADAGVDRSVTPSASVTLDGSGSSDLDGSIISYVWTQLTGTSVSITNSDQMTATFTAPDTEGDLSFELLVSDDGGASDRDTVNITVVEVGISLVFISQYVEGSSNNKYLEIYNGGTAAVDLEAEGYTLARDDNANMDFTYAVLSDWGSLNTIPAGDVIVLAAYEHTLYTSPDTVLSYNSPVHFNGNDAVALLKDGVVVDIVGELGNSVDHIKDMTLTRNSNITQGNPTFTWTEWTQSAQNDISGLGTHSVGGPSFENVVVTPDFILDNTAINVQVDVIPSDGGAAMASGVIAYGDGFLNILVMFAVGDTWFGQIPASATTGNMIFEFIFRMTDASSNQYESAVQSLMIGSTTSTPIADIHTNITSLIGSISTINGNMSIGTGLLAVDWTSAYIQDASGRGLNLYTSSTDLDLPLGTEVTIIGEVDQYNTTVEIKDFLYLVTSSESTIPNPAAVTVAEAVANPLDYEGTLISLTGEVTANTAYSTATNLTINDGTGETTIRIYTTTGIDATQYMVGQTFTFIGVGSQYQDAFQVLVGYEADTYLAVEDEFTGTPATFALNPAYPNPFNPTTKFNWQVKQAGNYHLSVFNLLGQEIGTLLDRHVEPGNYITEWNAGALPSGVYFIRLTGEGQQAIQKIMLLK